jgi:opacity protein-like surface antigen
MRSIRTPLVIAALTTLVALPALAQGRNPYDRSSSSVRVRFGEFTPNGDNDYWIDKRADFTGDEDDFADDMVGIDYLRAVGPRMDVLISIGSWETDVAQEYREFVDPDGLSIFHTTSFELSSLEVGLIWRITGRDATVSPYFGAGGGWYDWSLTEDGEFIDFTDLSIFSARFTDSGDTYGWFWIAGLEVPVGESWRIFAEGRWTEMEDSLSGDFEGLGTLDLGGTTVSFGAGWSF